MVSVECYHKTTYRLSEMVPFLRWNMPAYFTRISISSEAISFLDIHDECGMMSET